MVYICEIDEICTGLLKCAHCSPFVTAEIKKNQYVYYRCSFDKGSCSGLIVTVIPES